VESHTPRKSGTTIDLYTTFPWEALCTEVAKLKVQRHERGQLARLALAASGEKKTPARLMAAGALLHPVEAAGIEPASESLPSFDPTCVVRDLLRPTDSHGRDSVSRSWMISPPRVQAPSTASPHYDGPTPPHGPRAGGPRTRKLLVRQPARAQRCRWLLCLCQWFYEQLTSSARVSNFHAPVETRSPPSGTSTSLTSSLLHPP
jgi:hypothetical protein